MQKIVLFLAAFFSSFAALADVFSLPADDVLYENNAPFYEYSFNDENGCRFRYLSLAPPASDWRVQIKDNNACLKKGYATVSLIDGKNVAQKKYEGYFLDGFFIDQLPLNSHAFKRSAASNGEQYLYYQIEKDDTLGINYYGKMTAYPRAEDYSAFLACAPFQIILQTQNKALFAEVDTIKNLTTVIKSYASILCPAEQTILVQATDSPSLDENGVFFQMRLYRVNENADWTSDMTQYKNDVRPLQKPVKPLAEVHLKEELVNPNKNALTPQTQALSSGAMQNPEKLLNDAMMTGTKQKGTFQVIKDSNRGAFIDSPFVMQIKRNLSGVTMKKGCYIISGSLEAMDDFSKKKAGIPVRQNAAFIEIETLSPCPKDLGATPTK